MLDVQIDGAIATLTLRGPNGNRLDVETAHALAAAWRQVGADATVRCIILTGAGDAFCAGSDGDVPLSLDPADYDVWTPVVVAVNGRCAGAGLRFVGQGDIILAAESAVFAGAPLAAGLPVEDFLYQRRRLPLPLAELLILAGGAWTIDAARAYEVGWVSEVVPAEQLLPRARQLAEAVARNDPTAVRRTKEILVRSRDLFLRDAVEQARAAVVPLARNRAARRAILERA
ncbi:MAG: enoyl-CoA hydratase/isomerase family protein [Chloroflexota bacterium]|nr:enoyl-CoA hydratase/isomerase family protein [Dehalococcoidia bacterium]MDW8252245.1 enoyl-CoA hydratase/isomerase family protein [Chloroflexota bacterium]